MGLFRGWVLFKIDFEKAYDYVDLDFLEFVLSRMSFGERWIGWMKRCVMCARVLGLVNGYAGKEFKMERSLRQSCPLSHLLFNLVAESTDSDESVQR